MRGIQIITQQEAEQNTQDKDGRKNSQFTPQSEKVETEENTPESTDILSLEPTIQQAQDGMREIKDTSKTCKMKTAETNKPEEIEPELNAMKNIPTPIQPATLQTNKTMKTEEDKTGVSRQVLISKIEENIETLKLYEEKLKSMEQTIVKHIASETEDFELEKEQYTELRKSVENLKSIPRNEDNPGSRNQETNKSETLQKRSIRENFYFSEQVIL